MADRMLLGAGFLLGMSFMGLCARIVPPPTVTIIAFAIGSGLLLTMVGTYRRIAKQEGRTDPLSSEREG